MSFGRSNEDIIRKAASFFASEEWWKPVLNFLATKCKCFRTDVPTHQEFEVYLEFISFLSNLIDKDLCENIQITQTAFENVMFSMYDDENTSAKVIVETLKNAADFSVFRSQMLQNNIRIENAVTKAFMTYTEEHPEIRDAEQVAFEVTKMVQEQEDQILELLLQKSCHQMRALLGIGTGQRSPRASPKKPRINQDIDPEEVERRRKFYMQQRDLLVEQEEKQGKRKRIKVKRKKDDESESTFSRSPPM